MTDLVMPARPAPPPINIDGLKRALELATDPVDIKEIEDKLDAFERYMKNTALYSIEEMHPINEAKIRARWKLGMALASVQRGAGRPDNSGGDRPNFMAFIRDVLKLKDTTAKEAQRIGTLPEKDLAKACAEARKEKRLLHYTELLKRSQPFWKQSRKNEKRERREAIPDDLPAAPSDRYRLIHGDIGTVDIEPNSIDCIVTDPPYPEEFLPLFGTLAERASIWLKPGGSMLVMSGSAWLPQVLQQLVSHGLTYQWALAYLTPGGQAAQIFPRKVNSFWKPVFWLVKGEYSGDWIGDVARSDVNDNDKRFHHWGQSESGIADLIDRISLPGHIILDPFCGGGTTGAVAIKMNRLFVGIDLSEKAIETTAARLEEASHAAV